MNQQGPVRGESTIDIEVEEVEDDENVEYIREEDSVRYVAGWLTMNEPDSHEGDPPERVPSYETTPFECWGETQCLEVAANAAADHVNTELDTDGVGGGITSTVEGEDRVAIVSVESVLDREGKIVEETDVEFGALVSATPVSVKVTYRLDGQEYELETSVYARSAVIQWD